MEFVCPPRLWSSVRGSSIANYLCIIAKCWPSNTALALFSAYNVSVHTKLSASLPRKLFKNWIHQPSSLSIIMLSSSRKPSCLSASVSLSFITIFQTDSLSSYHILSLIFLSILTSTCSQSLYHQFSIQTFSEICSSSFLLPSA